MTERLTVEIDGPELADVPAEFRTSGPFTVRVDNNGRATHVHLGLEGHLQATDGNPDANHFVDSDGSIDLAVDVSSVPAEGTLTVATGHGAEEATVPIRVDGSMSEATSSTADAGAGASEGGIQFDDESLSVAAVALLGIGLAAVALLVTEDLVVLVGALLVVTAAVFGTIYLLLS